MLDTFVIDDDGDGIKRPDINVNNDRYIDDSVEFDIILYDDIPIITIPANIEK
jgi:hypothetical protein